MPIGSLCGDCGRMDDLVLRDYGTQRLYAMHDYFNCTAIVDTSGVVQERYGYNGFGQVRFMTAGFGSLSGSSYGWETLFANYRSDSETGFYQIRYRYFHPNLGRWLTRDPITYKSDTNLHCYCGNSTTNNVDPSGLLSISTFKIVGKSYIANIGSAIGTAPPGGSQTALNLFAAATDLAYSETEVNDAEDQMYRLYSERSFCVECDENNKLTSLYRAPLQTDSGLEPTKYGPIKAPDLTIVSSRSALASNILTFSWKVRGRPDPMFEPAFSAVITRTCWYIWHQIDGMISCQYGQAVISVSISGSNFPTHLASVNNSLYSLTGQGPFSGLWSCSASPPIEIL